MKTSGMVGQLLTGLASPNGGARSGRLYYRVAPGPNRVVGEYVAHNGQWYIRATGGTVPEVLDESPVAVPSLPYRTSRSATGFAVGWLPVTDAVSYRVYLGGALHGSTTNTSYTVTGRTPSTPYSVTVASVDGAGNVSAQSAATIVTTLAAGGAVPIAAKGMRFLVLGASEFDGMVPELQEVARVAVGASVGEWTNRAIGASTVDDAADANRMSQQVTLSIAANEIDSRTVVIMGPGTASNQTFLTPTESAARMADQSAVDAAIAAWWTQYDRVAALAGIVLVVEGFSYSPAYASDGGALFRARWAASRVTHGVDDAHTVAHFSMLGLTASFYQEAGPPPGPHLSASGCAVVAESIRERILANVDSIPDLPPTVTFTPATFVAGTTTPGVAVVGTATNWTQTPPTFYFNTSSGMVWPVVVIDDTHATVSVVAPTSTGTVGVFTQFGATGSISVTAAGAVDLFADNFIRANGAPGNGWVGDRTAVGNIVGNALRKTEAPTSGFSCLYNRPSGGAALPANYFVTWRFSSTVLNGNGYFGFIGRYAGPGSGCGVLFIGQGRNVIRFNDGNYSDDMMWAVEGLPPSSWGVPGQHELSLGFNGTNATLYFDGVQVGSHIGTLNNAAGTGFGLIGEAFGAVPFEVLSVRVTATLPAYVP